MLVVAARGLEMRGQRLWVMGYGADLRLSAAVSRFSTFPISSFPPPALADSAPFVLFVANQGAIRSVFNEIVLYAGRLPYHPSKPRARGHSPAARRAIH